MRNEPLRDYIGRGGEVAWNAPSAFHEATLYGFLVKADAAHLQEIWTRYICVPSRELGVAIDVRGLDHVLFVFLDCQRRQTARTGSRGLHQERLFAIVVPGCRMDPVEPGLVVFAPYVCASDAPGWIAEREIYGYPQQLGFIDIDSTDDQWPASLSLKAHTIQTFGVDADAEKHLILQFDRIDSAPGQGGRVSPATFVDQVFQARVPRRGDGAGTIIRQRRPVTAADLAFCARFSRDVPEPPNPQPCTFHLRDELLKPLQMLFLKQFRDVVYADRACYQAIVEAPLIVTGNPEFADQDYALILTQNDSAPIRRELGIPGDPETRVPVDLAFRIVLGEVSIDAEKTRVVSNPYWNPAVEVSTPNEPSNLPRYVDRGGEAVWRQPSLLHGARIYGFGMKASTERQQKMLTKYINNVASEANSTYGSEKKFNLCACTGLDIVMLLFVEYKRITSGTDDDKRLGGTAYREFLAMQLALSLDEEYPEIDWFIPFIYLDRDAPRIGGREIFGYPKQLATIPSFERYQDSKGNELEPAKTLQLSATVIRDLSRDEATIETVVTVEAQTKSPPTIEKRYVNAQEMFLDLWQHVGNRSELQNLVHSIAPGMSFNEGLSGPGIEVQNALLLSNIGNVFLKQFRDCIDPTKACYQAVCKTDTVPGRFHGGGCLDPTAYRVKIANHQSEPLLEFVDHDDSTNLEGITPTFAYWLDLDFELTNGRVIANPLEDDYAPDLSVGVTSRTTGRRRRVRRSGEPESDPSADDELEDEKGG